MLEGKTCSLRRAFTKCIDENVLVSAFTQQDAPCDIIGVEAAIESGVASLEPFSSSHLRLSTAERDLEYG
jgi:hypothetical protein